MLQLKTVHHTKRLRNAKSSCKYNKHVKNTHRKINPTRWKGKAFKRNLLGPRLFSSFFMKSNQVLLKSTSDIRETRSYPKEFFSENDKRSKLIHRHLFLPSYCIKFMWPQGEQSLSLRIKREKPKIRKKKLCYFNIKMRKSWNPLKSFIANSQTMNFG